MKSHTLPFENRWTSNVRAWEWHCELERLGVPNVRSMFSEHETHHQEEPTIIFDVPPGFVRDWLAFHDHRAARQEWVWRASMVVLTAIAAAGAVFGAFK